MRAVVKVEPDRLRMDRLQIVRVVHFIELMRRAFGLGKPRAKLEFRGVTGRIPIPHGEVVHSNTALLGIPEHSREERESLPDPDVQITRVLGHARHAVVDDRRVGERTHSRDVG